MPEDQPAREQPLVIFMPAGRRGRVPAGTSLLDAAQQVGVGIESICGGRLTCGKCKIRIEEGTFQKHGIVSGNGHVSPPGPEEAGFLKRLGAEDCRLSCATHVQDDVLVTVPEESQARKQIIRKSATDRVIEVKPAVHQVYVEVEEALLEDQRGDWERLRVALAEQWDLEDLRIDYYALRDLQRTLRKGDWAATVTLWQPFDPSTGLGTGSAQASSQGSAREDRNREVIDVRPGYHEGAYGLAVDIGSTTVAAYLCDLRTGEVLATEAMMNPQVTYGEDLMSRVSYATSHSDGLTRMHRAIIDALNQLAGRTAAQACTEPGRSAGIKTRDIYEAVLVGNTVMHHILLGIDPVELGRAPFALATHDPIDVKAHDLGLRLNPGANVHILPLEAGHVGADNVAVLLAEAPHRQDEMMLIIDVGTNGEILLGNRHRVLSASSPTGPAFEGAQITHGMRAAPGAIERVRIDPATKQPRFKLIGDDRWSDKWGEDTPTHQLASGICGSGIIEAVAELYLAGIVRPDGRFDPDGDGPWIVWNGRAGAYLLATADQTTTGEPILVTQADVRAIQLAKGALYAGAKLLMNRAGVTRVDKIVLAGAFGSYIDPKHAMVLGLIPDCDLGRVYAVGNAAGDGARIALLNRDKRREAQEVARWVEYVETAVEPEFQEEFVAAMHIPHMRDPFPHVESLLPDALVYWDGREKRRQHRRERRKT
ncbi:MAG: ASKHA domain-containing protein [Anaerolineae bacterium]